MTLGIASTSLHAASEALDFNPDPADPFGWLEEVEGERPLEWVDRQNEKTLARLTGDARYEPTRDYIYKVLTDPDKLATGDIIHDKVYNFWTDAKNPRGLFRVASLDSYRSGNPQWEVILDVDELARVEATSWYFGGAAHASVESGRVMIRLTRDGRDAVTCREFDLKTKRFVEGGFFIPEAKSRVSWLDDDRLFVATDEGPGSLNRSGYPVNMRLLARGQSLVDAPLIHRANTEHPGGGVYAGTERSSTGEVLSVILTESRAFENTTTWVLDHRDPLNSSTKRELPVPVSAEYAGLYRGEYLALLTKDWPEKGLKVGTLISLALGSGPEAETKISVVYESRGDTVVVGASASDRYLYVSLLKNARRTLDRLTKVDGRYERVPLHLPADREVSISLGYSDWVHVQTWDFLLPLSVSVQPESQAEISAPVFRSRSRFDESKFEAHQYRARSQDGTEIPYFIVMPKNRAADEAIPTRLYAYGGFNVSQTPSYLGLAGKLWLEDAGGAYVLANIRGGGEFGKAWHDAAKVPHRNKAFEDLIAVGEDLVLRKIAAPKGMSIEGGSNGGLLTAAVAMMRPDLFGAVVSSVPLTDMLRYHRLSAGASWMVEYGNPDADPAARAFWERYSPYHNVKPDWGYPEILFTTSTADDRVHPAHARKMVARLESQGHPVMLFENREGGHGGAADSAQSAKVNALKLVYLCQKLLDRTASK